MGEKMDMTKMNSLNRFFTRDMFNGEIIEDRPDDIPTPSCLILGSSIRGRFLHVICGVLDDMVYIISAYYPDPDKWEADSRKG